MMNLEGGGRDLFYLLFLRHFLGELTKTTNSVKLSDLGFES
jgi:hypothetical protein